MTPAAALAAREDLAPAAIRPTARSWRGHHLPGVVALLVATVLTRLIWPDSVGAVERAAAWSGSLSWKAWFFGTLDPQAATSVGSPAAAWLGALAVRFGGSTGLTVLGVVLTVLAVAVLAAAVRRVAGPAAGLLAGGVLAVLLRSDPAEAQLALLLATAGCCVVRGGRARWVVGAGFASGFAVLTAGWVGLAGLVVLTVVLLLRSGFRPWRRALTDVVVLVGSAAAPLGGWLLVALWWPGGRPAAALWTGSVAGLLTPLAATVLAVTGVWLWRGGGTALRSGLVVALVVLVGLGAAARTTEVATPSVEGSVSTVLSEAGTTWSAAAVGHSTTAALELSTGTAVLALDGSTTLAQFQSYVATGRVHYLLAPAGTATGSTEAILEWVADEHTATTVGGSTVYDLTSTD